MDSTSHLQTRKKNSLNNKIQIVAWAITGNEKKKMVIKFGIDYSMCLNAGETTEVRRDHHAMTWQ
jgi:hypothetical protein